MIVSIPHSGTRSLHFLFEDDEIFHFGMDEHIFTKRDDIIDFPVRDPLMNYVSWVAYGTGDAEEFVSRYERAIDYLKERDVRYYVMEHFPHFAGKGPKQPMRVKWWREEILPYVRTRDPSCLNTLDDLPVLFEWVETEKPREFFSRFYTRFWWLDGIADKKPNRLEIPEEVIQRARCG